MRIVLIVHQYLPAHVGGTEVYTWTLAQALSGQGHEVTVFHPDPQVVHDHVDSAGAHRVWHAPVSRPVAAAGPLGQFWRTFRNPATERSYRRLLQSVQPDVIHVQHLQNVSARLLALSDRRPVFLTLHDYWYRCATGQLVRVDGAQCRGPSVACADCARARSETRLPAALRPLVALPMGYRNAYLSWMLSYVHQFLAPSDYVRDQYIRWGWDPARIITLPPGVDRARLQPRSEKPPRPDGGPVFGYLGSIAPTKGVHVLVQAFEGLPPGARLIVFGDREAFPNYVAQLEGIVRHPGIRFAGKVDPERVGEALRAVDCLVVPSLTHETHSLVVDEASAAGIPTVASRMGALTRIVDGTSGRLFQAGNVAELHGILQELYENRQLLQHYARRLPVVPTIDDQVSRLVAMYEAAALACRRK
ncbi:MAG: glycosyltransferase [Anaerolineae bacterium]